MRLIIIVILGKSTYIASSLHGKEPQMGEQDRFFGVCSTSRNVSCWQRWLLFAERIKGRNEGESRGALYVAIHKSKGKATKQTGRRKKKAKPGHTNMVTQGHKCNKKG